MAERNVKIATIVQSIKSKSWLLCDSIWRKPSDILFNTYKTFHLKNVSPDEVCDHLSKLKRKKATGNDDLPSALLKDSKHSIKHPLCHIINLSISTGIISTAWKNAKIIPVYKSGTRSTFDNYRPISILPILSKILEKIVHNQLYSYLEENELLYSRQFGFRKDMSTEQAVTILLDDIRSHVDKGDIVGACFIDLTKAFDTISHSKLLPKYGIHDRELDWFTDYLFCRTANVKFDQCESESFDICSGVPQGSILGPLLFLLIFNDLGDVIKYSKLIKYADDTVLYCNSKNVEDITTKMNADLDAV